MRKIFILLAATICAVGAYAASITASDVDFGIVSIKGQSSVTATEEIPVSWNGLSNQGYYIYAEITSGDDNFFISGESSYYMGYGAKMTYSTTFTIGCYAETAGTYTGTLRFYSYDTGYNEVEKIINLRVVVSADAIVANTTPFTRINSTSELHEGDTVVFVNEASGAVSGPLNGTYLTAITEGVSVDAAAGTADIPEGVQAFKMHQYSGNWQFLFIEDETTALLLDYVSNDAKGAFATVYAAGQTVKTWEISISNGEAAVFRPNDADPAYPVRFNSDRFKPYKTEATGTSFALYKKAGEAQEVSSSLEIEAIQFGDVELGESAEVTVNYTAENLTDDIIWEVEGTDAALFSVTDQGDRTGGTVTITYLGTGTQLGAVDAHLSYLTQDIHLEIMEGTAPITINLVPTTTKLTNLAFTGAPSTIDQGQSIDLSPYIVYTPNDAADKSLVWSVDHTYQGEVSEAGVLTAKHVGGTITVTATSVRVPSVSASHTLTITEPVVTDFTLSHSEMTMHKGDTQTLYVTAIVPDYASVSPTFSSNNTAVATISNRGLLTARGIGEAVITATIGSVERTCTVQVQPVEVTSVGFDPATVSLTVGSNLQLNPDVLPAQAKDEYPMTYVSDNEAAATVGESGMVTGIAEGQAVITATIGGVSGQITINVVAASMFTKVTDASTLAAKDTIVLALHTVPVIAGARDGKKLTVLTSGITVTESEAYADAACRLVLGTEKNKEGFTLTIVGGKTIAVTSTGNDIVDANTQNCKFWEFVEDGNNGYFVRNLGNTNAMFKYNAGNAAIKPYKLNTAGAVYVYAYVRKYVDPVETGMEETQAPLVESRKLLRDGQVLILRNGEVYTVTGMKL